MKRIKPTVDIQWLDGQRHVQALGERATIGCAESASVRIPLPGVLEPEHLLVVPQGKEGVWAAVARDAGNTVLLPNGTALASAVLPWGTCLSVGPLRVHLLARPPSRESSQAAKRPPLHLLLAVAAALILAAVAVARAGGEDSLPTAPENIPELFADLPGCPDDVEPRSHARYLYRAALARQERYPYDPSDGVEAVRMFAESGACFALAGEEAAAKDTAARQTAFQSVVEADYSSLRLDLARSLRAGAHERAMTSVRRLLPLVTHLENSHYTAKLRRIERLLSLKGGTK